MNLKKRNIHNTKRKGTKIKFSKSNKQVSFGHSKYLFFKMYMIINSNSKYK